MKGGWKGSWMTMSFVKLLLARGLGGSGGLERVSATLLDSLEMCLMLQMNWLMKRR